MGKNRNVVESVAVTFNKVEEINKRLQKTRYNPAPACLSASVSVLSHYGDKPVFVFRRSLSNHEYLEHISPQRAAGLNRLAHYFYAGW